MEKRLSVVLIIIGMAFITLFLIQENEVKNLKNKLSVQKEQLKYKDELIESQVKTLIEDSNNNCYCGFFEDFYYEYADDVGAFE